MASDEWEFGRVVVEPFDLRPPLCGMTNLAAEPRAIGCRLAHAVRELPPVRIVVAARTGQIGEVIRNRLTRAREFFCLVAVNARHSHVAADEPELGFFVSGKRKRRGGKTIHGMTSLAAVAVGGAGKLTLVDILVATRAEVVLELIDSVHSSGLMALAASDGCVPSFQGIRGGSMLS